MKKRTAELILKDPEKFAHHDRVFLNNPVVMQGMGLAPLVVVATTGQNGLMLAAAVTLLLVPSRVLACLLSRLVPLRDEEPTPEQLQKKLLPRALLYAASAAVVYLAAYPILNFVFGTGLLNLGIYLPMLVVEPLLTYRFGRVQETVHKAVSKGVRITVGYALLLLVVGVVREWLSLGTVFGAPVGRWALLPLAKMPAGGFIVLGILCAIWRAAAAKRKEYLKREARDTLTVHTRRRGTANREGSCKQLGSVFQLCTAGHFCTERCLYPCTGRVPHGAAGGGRPHQQRLVRHDAVHHAGAGGAGGFSCRAVHCPAG